MGSGLGSHVSLSGPSVCNCRRIEDMVLIFQGAGSHVSLDALHEEKFVSRTTLLSPQREGLWIGSYGLGLTIRI